MFVKNKSKNLILIKKIKKKTTKKCKRDSNKITICDH